MTLFGEQAPCREDLLTAVSSVLTGRLFGFVSIALSGSGHPSVHSVHYRSFDVGESENVQ